MNYLNAMQAVAVVGVSAFLYFKFKNSIIPGIAGFVDNTLGSAFRSVVVPEGPNGIVVEYWKRHGVDIPWFMSIANGQREIPSFMRLALPGTVTVGMLYQALFNWALATTIGDVESYLACGLPGKEHDLISNLSQYCDATEWRIDTFETLMNAIHEAGLWDVIL